MYSAEVPHKPYVLGPKSRDGVLRERVLCRACKGREGVGGARATGVTLCSGEHRAVLV